MVVNNPNWGEHRTETRSLGEGGKWMCVCVVEENLVFGWVIVQLQQLFSQSEKNITHGRMSTVVLEH